LSKIRPERVTAQSAGVLAEIHAKCFEHPWTERALTSLLSFPSSIGLLARESKTGLGMALIRCAADEAEILTICVVADKRGQGLGHQLLEHAERLAVERGVARVFLEVSVNNETAQKLYFRAGYSEKGRRPGYYVDGSDALLLEKSLSKDGQNPSRAPITQIA
jgi:ribosomal-protein-alanine N-acetyltransferase